MDRLDFYYIETVNNIKELDYLHHNLSKFTINYDVDYYRVVEPDIMRPDMISYKTYGTVNYWWVICLVNQIFDPFNDLYVGQQLKIPNILDVYGFYKNYSMR